MTRLIPFLTGLALCWMTGVAWQVLAHQQKAAISSIYFNPRTGNMEVAHRFYVHDAEHAVKLLVNGKADLMKDVDAQKAFALYVAEQFAVKLTPDDGKALTLLGQEVKGKFFWVYQEVPVLIKPVKMTVSHRALMEIWPSQRNVVNIEGLGRIRTVELLAQEYRKSVSFQ